MSIYQCDWPCFTHSYNPIVLQPVHFNELLCDDSALYSVRISSDKVMGCMFRWGIWSVVLCLFTSGHGAIVALYLDRPSWSFVIFPYFIFLLFWPEFNVLCSRGLLCRHVMYPNLHVINILHSFKMRIVQKIKSKHLFLEDELYWF